MNTAIRVLTAGYVTPNFPAFRLTLNFSVWMLSIFLLISALGVVYVKDLQRRLFIQYQTLQQTHQNAVWTKTKLLLEQSTWSAETHIQQIAQKSLAMIIPQTADRVVV